MIKPKALKRGDTAAIVSLSSGMGGEKPLIHRYYTASMSSQCLMRLKEVNTYIIILN